MSRKDVLIQEIEDISEEKLQEVIDFVRFLKLSRQEEKLEPALLSENSLAKDWVNPKEDDAWSDL
jgi:hypothetical protein